MDQALLVGLAYKASYEETMDSLVELEHLALALNIKTKDKVIQNAKEIIPRTYIGSGKVQEIKTMISVLAHQSLLEGHQANLPHQEYVQQYKKRTLTRHQRQQ
ncbi:MAG: hypothetical protein LRY20_00970 [Acholeplasmataceae bacterium]|nr:hypothetical protein [Acholeplasmataceae bacterium]